MKIEPNMYVRTKYGIFKIRKITKDLAYCRREKRVIELDRNIPEYNYRFSFYKDESIFKGAKFKNNIIDLIEVGDVITFKNDEDVYRVSCVPNEESACDCFYLVFNYATQYGVEDIEVSKEIMQNTLESVITRKQFEKIAYKVGD